MKLLQMLRSRWIGLVLWLVLLSGISLIAYPWLHAWQEERKQLQLLAEWSAELQMAAAVMPQIAYAAGDNVPVRLANTATAAIDDNRPLPQWKEVDGLELLGSLQIASINLEEPIVKGADAKALKHGAGTVLEEPLPGQMGNFVLAGHRGWTSTRYFSRLDELNIGDSIEIHTTAGTFRYSIFEKLVVEPDDLSVLQTDPGKSILTLITCHPKSTHTHRLIVKATLLFDKE